MLNINFKVDEEILARYLIKYNRFPSKEFADMLWEKFNNAYRALHRDIDAKNIDYKIIEIVKEQPFFKEFITSAKENKPRIEANFKEKSDFINDYLSKIFKTEVDIPPQTAYIGSTMPNMQMGANIRNNRFVWGHRKGMADKNYDLVYLVHESLHSVFERNGLTHTIIENIADIGLCRALSEGNIKQYDSHNSLKSCHKKILPYWNLYLNKTEEEIDEEIQTTGFNYNQSELEPLRENLSKMNIFDFIDFCNKTLNIEEADMNL